MILGVLTAIESICCIARDRLFWFLLKVILILISKFKLGPRRQESFPIVRKSGSTSLLRTAPKLLAAGNLWVKAGLKFSFVDNLPLLRHIHSRLTDAK